MIDQEWLDKWEIDYVAHDEEVYPTKAVDDVYDFVKRQGESVVSYRSLPSCDLNLAHMGLLLQANSFPPAAPRPSRRPTSSNESSEVTVEASLIQNSQRTVTQSLWLPTLTGIRAGVSERSERGKVGRQRPKLPSIGLRSLRRRLMRAGADEAAIVRPAQGRVCRWCRVPRSRFACS
jgi:hypothetical protein